MLSDLDDSSDDSLLNVDVDPSLCWQASAEGASLMKTVYKSLLESSCEEMHDLRAKLDCLQAVAKKDTAAAKEYVGAAEKLVSGLSAKCFITFSRHRGAQDDADIEKAEKDLRKMRESMNTAAVESDKAVEPTASHAHQAASNNHKRALD